MKDWLTMTGRRAAFKGAAAVIAALASLALLITHPAQAASFDCEKAAMAVEKMICSDAELSKLDEVLGAAYERVLTQAANPKVLKSKQHSWLHDTRNACREADCLKKAYSARIAELKYFAEELPLGPPARRGPDTEFAEFDIELGRNEPVCRAVARGLRQSGVVLRPGGVCGIPFPGDDADFQHVPAWQDLDPAINADLVREIYYWSNATPERLGSEAWERQLISISPLSDLMAEVWEASETRVLALIAAGRVELQVSQFDFDNDGEDETVYRMTGLSNGNFMVKQCLEVASGWSDIPYIYVGEKAGKRYRLPMARLVFANLNYFKYKGKTYIAFSGSMGIKKPFPVKEYLYPPDSVCRFSPRKERR